MKKKEERKLYTNFCGNLKMEMNAKPSLLQFRVLDGILDLTPIFVQTGKIKSLRIA
jgi:hypothetical protein